MMEGFQVIDYKWRYIYVNDAAVKHGHTTKKDLIGKTMMEAYPGIEKTKMFSVLRRCMKKRATAQIENEFTYHNGEKRWFNLSIQPVPEGIFILSIDITERKKAEEALRNSENEKSSVLDSMSELVIHQDLEHRILWVNRKAAESVNMKVEQLKGHYCYELWANSANPCAACPLEETRKTDQPQQGEMTTPDGRIWSINSYPIRDEKGNITSIVELVTNVTEQKKAEEKLKQSEERYRTVFESTGTAMCILEEDKMFSLVNREFEELVGYSQEELKGKEWTEFVTKEYLERMKKYHEARRKNGETAPKQYTFDLINKNGQIRNAMLTIDIIPGTKKSVASIIDITEHKKAEEALREEKEKFETYLNLARVIMIAIDTEGIVTYVNKRGCEVLGYKGEEIVGKDWFSNFLPEIIAKKTKNYLKNLLSGQIKPVEYNENPVLTKSGEERLIAWYTLLLRDQKGEVIGTLSSGKDITELKKAEQEMKEISYSLNGISHGECYISEAEKKLMNVFAYSVVYGRSGLCITRKNPEILTEQYSLKPEHIRLLSSTPMKGFHVLGNLQEVSLEISNFLKNGGGIVLLEGLEYLVSRFGFNPVYSMLQEKRFDFRDADAVLLISINFEALTTQQKALLASEFKTIK